MAFEDRNCGEQNLERQNKVNVRIHALIMEISPKIKNDYLFLECLLIYLDFNIFSFTFRLKLNYLKLKIEIENKENK